jgi:VWFA-related protein
MRLRFPYRRQSLGAVLLLLHLASGPVWGQQPTPDLPSPVVRVWTHLVLVDVLVKDKNGQHLTGLNLQDFTLLEDGKPQKIATFAIEQPAEVAKTLQGQLPVLPPNVATNRPAYLLRPGTPTILLLDALNTRVQDQARARLELLRYLDTQLEPGRQLAVYTLGRSLQVLQDFTDDPRLLKAAIESFTPEKPLQLQIEDVDRRMPSLPGATAGARGDIRPDIGQVLERIRGFYTEESNVALDTRVGITLTAFRQITRAVMGLPGRKSLIWVSGSFPLATFSRIIDHSETPSNDPNYVSVEREYEDLLRQTASLLNDAQIAVYPVDARGLIGSVIDDASQQGVDAAGRVKLGAAFGQEVMQKGSVLQTTQASMKVFADDTGGLVFVNRNDMDHAVALSVADTSTYYVLGYYPQDKDWNGKYRKIQVKLNRPGLDARHRRGYYALAPMQDQKRAKTKDAELALAMRWDAPEATMVTFDARVLLSPPAARMKVSVEFLVDPTTVTAEDAGNGAKRYALEFHVAAYTPRGELAAQSDKAWKATLKPADDAAIRQQGLPFRTELDLAPGRYKLRLGAVDDRTAYIGTTSLWVNVGESKK